MGHHPVRSYIMSETGNLLDFIKETRRQCVRVSSHSASFWVWALDNKVNQYKVDCSYATINLYEYKLWDQFFYLFHSHLLRWCIFDIQTAPSQALLQMFVLAIASPISKAVGTHQHSNNVPWHRKAICYYFRAGTREKKQTSAVFSLILLSDWASGVSFQEYSKNK